ncbi:phage minor structural protein [Clostridiales bacterium oral taxon 876 str. F0540]|nr:phage minor structural protein [Clostridiales bacterium oral taxon 876 str. F0540]
MIIIYDSKETNFNNNGLGLLDNIAKSCRATYSLNGEKYLEIEVIKDEDEKYKWIQEFCIIKADDDLFRLYNKQNIQNNTLSVRAVLQHISNDINTDFIEDSRAENTTVDVALQKVVLDKRFNVLKSDMTNLNTAYFVKDKPLPALKDKIIGRWGGELYRKNFDIGIFSRIGKDTEIQLEYAKDITGFEQSIDWTGMTTRMMPTGKDGITIEPFNGGSKWIESPRINSYFKPLVNEVKFEDIEDSGVLKTEAEKLWGTIDIPKVNYKVNFISLQNTVEYKNDKAYQQLEQLNEGDSVRIKHIPFDCNITARVIKVVRDCITGRNIEIELGQFKENYIDKVNNIKYNVQNVSADLQETKQDLENAKVEFKQTTDGIEQTVSQKIDGEEAKTIISQSAKEVRAAINNTHYSFTEDAFTIGNTNIGDNVEHTPTYSKYKHNDGSYTKIDADGINRYVAGNKENYHYLMVTGEDTTYPSNDRFKTVQLPDEFKGKDFKVSVEAKRTVTTETNVLLSYFECSKYSVDYVNATFTVYGSCWYAKTTNLTDVTNRGWMDFSYIAIA